MLTRRALLTASLALAACPAAAAPRARLWDRWLAEDPASDIVVDHSIWAGVLAAHRSLAADGVARVDYARLPPLGGYLDQLSSVAVGRLRRAEQFAFWCNLYNALTVELIRAHWPIASIRDIDISPGLFSDGPWGAELIMVEGEGLTLDDIEHRILRPIWREPRLHYVVNCGALGCPDLPATPLRAEGLDVQLDAAARAFVNHPRGASIEEGRLVVSSLYDWYGDDFGGSDAAVIRHLQSHAEAPLAALLAGRRRVDGDRYDWRVNAA